MIKKLTICIPTYNRKKILIENLNRILNIENICLINIIIFDDGNDGLDFDIAKIIKDHQYICYIKNEKNYGHDENIKRALLYANTSYVWLLGDSMWINNEYFNKIIELIGKEEYDAIVVDNNDGRINNYKINNPYNVDEFYVNFAWHCTLTGVVIYNKRVINESLKNLTELKFRNFIQYAILFEGLDSKSKIFILNDNVVLKNEKRSSSYWVRSPFEVFAKDWTDVNLNFTKKFGGNAVFNVIKSHAKNTGIFKGIMLIYLKANQGINTKNYFKLNELERQSVGNNSLFFKFILHLPDKLFIPILHLYKIIKSYVKNWKNKI